MTTNSFPPGFRSNFVQCGDVRLHVVHNGTDYNGKPLSDKRKVLLCLHGFPEFWAAWEEVMKHLSDDYLVIVPDQRGYNLSDAPEGVENYRAKLLVGDMIALTTKLLGDRTFSLAGHDWGASIAYALAINFSDRIDNLIIANGVHPACFQQALIDSPEQAKASAYFHILRGENAGELMAEDNFKRTFSMFEKFSLSPWLTQELKARYATAWADKTRLQAMLHWYNSSPMIVPVKGEPVSEAPLYDAPDNKFRIPMPHLVIWGMGDQALRPECRNRLPEFCDALTVHEIRQADHWILHTHGEEIAGRVKGMIG